MIRSGRAVCGGLAAVMTLAALTLPAAVGQPAESADFIDISAARSEALDREGRLLYEGDVNVIRGDARLRADQVEAFFTPREGGRFGPPIRRITAVGDVFYVTPAQIARGDRGVYDLAEATITLEGSVVLTEGCNVSTGERLVVDLDGGSARLSGGGEGENQRVRSVFFDDPDAEEGAPAPGECPQPTIPGDGPQAFEPRD